MAVFYKLLYVSFYRIDSETTFERHKSRIPINDVNSVLALKKHLISFLGLTELSSKFGLGDFDVQLYHMTNFQFICSLSDDLLSNILTGQVVEKESYNLFKHPSNKDGKSLARSWKYFIPELRKRSSYCVNSRLNFRVYAICALLAKYSV